MMRMFHVKRLGFIIALMLAAGAARADTVMGFRQAIDLVKDETWAEKVAFMDTLGGKFRKECKKSEGCAMVARVKTDDSDVVFTLIETFPTKDDSSIYRQWCIKEVGSWRLHCEDEKNGVK